MGFFDFMKGVGDKIFHPGDNRKEDAIKKHMQDNGIDTSGITIDVHDDQVDLSGSVKDVESKEKAVLIAGNIEGIAKVNDRLVAQTNSAVASAPSPDFSNVQTGVVGGGGGTGSNSGEGWTSRTYTVKSGDTLSHISKEMYGDANQYEKIFEANKPMLKSPDKIYPGQVLRIPA